MPKDEAEDLPFQLFEPAGRGSIAWSEREMYQKLNRPRKNVCGQQPVDT